MSKIDDGAARYKPPLLTQGSAVVRGDRGIGPGLLVDGAKADEGSGAHASASPSSAARSSSTERYGRSDAGEEPTS